MKVGPRVAILASGIFVALVAVGEARADDGVGVQEVVVRGGKTAANTHASAPGEISLANEEVRKVPGAFGDSLRIVDALPGAVPLLSGTPYAILRSAPPGNSATLIDGIQIPLLFHLGVGPAVIHPELIDRVDYFAGGAPARFGRAVGGVVSAETRAPSRVPRVRAHVRAFDAGALVESPLAGGRADALVAGRYSYTAAALSLLSPGVEIGYWDYQARAGLNLNEHERLSVFAFGSHDRRGQIAQFGNEFGSDFHRIDLRYDRKLTGTGTGAGTNGDRVRAAVTLGDDKSYNEQGGTHGVLLRTRLELERRLSPSAHLRAGADASLSHIDQGVARKVEFNAPASIMYPAHNDLTTGFWADVVWRPTERVEITPGVRLDMYEWRVLTVPPRWIWKPYLDYFGYVPERLTNTAVALDPRLASRFTIRRGLAAVSTVGIYHQGPSFFVPIPGLQPAVGFPRGLQSSLQSSAGLDIALPLEMNATGTVFWHEYRNVNTFTTCTIPAGGFDLESPCIGTRSNARSFGLEVLVKRSLTRRLGGWVAYTLSRSEYQLRPSAVYPVSHPWSAISFDHTHVLNVVGSLDLGRGWNTGARLFSYSGRPFAQNIRAKPFARLDVRLEKRWRPFIHPNGWIAVVLEGLNVTGAQEQLTTECDTSGRCLPVYQGAVVIPSIGVEAAL